MRGGAGRNDALILAQRLDQRQVGIWLGAAGKKLEHESAHFKIGSRAKWALVVHRARPRRRQRAQAILSNTCWRGAIRTGVTLCANLRTVYAQDWQRPADTLTA